MLNKDEVVNNKPNSTRHHRQVQRANGMSQVLGSALSEVSVAAIIPSKMAQTLFSGLAFFTPKLHPIERATHSVQASLALAQLVLVIMLTWRGEDCQNKNENLCKLLIILDLLYQGTLLVGWIPAEALKHYEDSAKHRKEEIKLAEDNLLLTSHPKSSPGNDSNSFFTINSGKNSSQGCSSIDDEEEKSHSIEMA